MSIVHDGATWSTNALGMRDRSYETAKPPRTFRIAFVGDSIGAGWGVNDGEGFEPLLERTLDERSKGAGGPAVEVLNFAVPGHGPGQRWEHFTRVGWAMDPDLVLFESTTGDPGWDERRLRGLLPRGIGWDAAVYRDALTASGARPGGTPETYKRVLRPFRDAFFAGVYRTVVADCRAHGVPCVLIPVPRVGKAADPAERKRMVAVAESAGFTLVADLTDAYDGLDPNDLAIGPRDFHPNADGHARLARRLDEAARPAPALDAALDDRGTERGSRVPMSHEPSDQGSRAARLCFVQTLIMLIVGLLPIPVGWARARSAMESTRSPDLNRADREATAGGYYEGLIGGGDSPEGARSELAMRLLGKPSDWVRFDAANVAYHLNGDFLMFALRPNVNRRIFGQPFVTNGQGYRDDPFTLEKPPGTFRVVVLGSSIDMGWGVGNGESYVDLLETWLNAHAKEIGTPRRFEVLNFAVAAYSPMQRLEVYRRKAAAYHPDLVLYSATLLDTRLIEIHLCDMLQQRVDPKYDFLRRTIADAGIGGDDFLREPDGKLANKASIKAKLRPRYWSAYDATLGTLAADCRSSGVTLACLIVPRVGKADAPDVRAERSARLRTIAAHHALTLIDLTDTFDHVDSTKVELAAWDDHPNALGHQQLFLRLVRALSKEPTLYSTLFKEQAVSP